MVTAIGLGTAVSATSASASTDYIINGTAATQACNYTYTHANGTVLAATWPAGAYTWDCGEYIYIPYPYDFWYLVENLGAPNLQQYCSITYPGSQAVRVSAGDNGWDCQV
jgi:hypothetical protein